MKFLVHMYNFAAPKALRKKIFLVPLAQDILGFFSLVGIGIARFKPKGLGLQGFRLKRVVRNPGLIPLWGMGWEGSLGYHS